MLKFSSEHLLNLINDILSLSKVEAGKYEVIRTNVFIYEIFEKIYKIYENLCNKKNIEFIFEYDKDIPNQLVLDKNILLQLLNNLMNNSLKFTEEGSILLKVNKKIIDNKNFLEIIIKDTGIGINKQKQKNLFEQFTQGENSLNKKYEGAGLGLSIVKKLIDLIEGDIKVETELNVGTTFILIIPYEKI